MLPRHVAIIMDGNGRWAKARGRPRPFGHHKGADAVRRIVTHARLSGIEVLTLYAFSTANWQRPPLEVTLLMQLFERFLDRELPLLLDNQIRLRSIGEVDRLPAGVQRAFARTEAATAHLRGMQLVLAVSYDGRRDLARATRRVAEMVARGELAAADVDENRVQAALSTASLPPVDLLIRTSGEQRLSGFLLFESAYAELHFTDKHWPDFDAADLDAAVADYGRRQRRFGLTGEQAAGALALPVSA